VFKLSKSINKIFIGAEICGLNTSKINANDRVQVSLKIIESLLDVSFFIERIKNINKKTFKFKRINISSSNIQKTNLRYLNSPAKIYMYNGICYSLGAHYDTICPMIRGNRYSKSHIIVPDYDALNKLNNTSLLIDMDMLEKSKEVFCLKNEII
jgi:hypothetical protein